MKKLWSEKKRRADLILIGALLLISAILYLILAAGHETGAVAVVRVNGAETARYPLAVSGSFPLNGGTNTLVIDGGEAWLTDADCPDKLCVKQGHIKYSGQCITCLPNRLTVTIEGGVSDGVDIVSR